MEKEYPIYESESGAETPLDIKAILAELAEFVREFELDLDLDSDEELAQLLGENDNDFLGNHVSFAIASGIDPDQLFTRLNIPLE